MRRLEVDLDWGDEKRHVGTLAAVEHRILFEYASEFLADPLPISPFKLPVEQGVFEDAERIFGGLHGVFHDSLPDGWGLLLMDREFLRRRVPLADVMPLDRLAYIGARGMGALTYRPPEDGGDLDGTPVDLAVLAGQAARLQRGSAEQVLPELRLAGGSPGGARPKVLVGYSESDDQLVTGVSDLPEGFQPYLVKFPAEQDEAGIGTVEYAYAQMALDAGVSMPPSRLFEASDGYRYFAVKRFDRDGLQRLHQHTLGGLLHASHRAPSLDYDAFLRVTLALTKDHAQLAQAFTRMVFNVIAHNRDDHAKNFSYLMDRDGDWRLAPAYDLIYSEGINGWHTTSIAGEAHHPSGDDMLRLVEGFPNLQRTAPGILQHVRRVVSSWKMYAEAAGVPAATTDAIAQRLGNVLP